MKIVYGITHKDEWMMAVNDYQNLQYLKPKDVEIALVILHDSNVPLDEKTKEMCDKAGAKVYCEPFSGDFSAHKNRMNELCEAEGADYIVQLDADETLMPQLNQDIFKILEKYPVDLILLPRLNYVNGITQEHLKMWGWRMDTIPMYGQVINWPDYQGRIYKAGMRWVGKVHERIGDYKTIMRIPPEPKYAISHTKTIQKQEAQNAKYQEMMSK